MKKRSRGWGVLFLVLAMVLVTVGLLLIFDGFGAYRVFVLEQTDREQLIALFQMMAVKLMAGGGMVVAGVFIGVILLLHLMRRTERMEREAEALRRRNEAAEELAHHQRLETLGTLTSSIAHEFNNLLTPIMGYSMMALEKLPPEEEALYDDILEIYSASRKAKTIISRLSDLSRKNTASVFRTVSPDELVQKTLDVANPAKPPKAEIKLNLNCWDQRIQANEIQMSQMLLNLILNGFHAIGDEPGTLTVETSFDENSIHIRIADTGCGIPEDIRGKIFQPFFTTKEAGRGTGLGLAIVAQVVEDHHGKIRVDSKVGEGTAFTISLPRNREESTME